MKHRASADFWACYRGLPDSIRDLADKCYRLLKEDPEARVAHILLVQLEVALPPERSVES